MNFGLKQTHTVQSLDPDASGVQYYPAGVARRGLIRLKETYSKNYSIYSTVFAVYTVAGLFSSYLFHITGTQPAVALAPQGIAIAAALIFGYSVTPIIALSAFLVALSAGNPFLLAFLAALANLAQPALVLFVLDKLKINRRLETAWDFYIYIALAFVACTIVPTINVLSRSLYNSSGATPLSPLVWSNLWVAGLVSALILTPFLVRTANPLRKFTGTEWIENLIMIVLLGITTGVLTYTPITTFLGISLLIPFCAILLWTALRGGTFFVTTAMVMVSVFAVSGRILGNPSNPQHMSLSAQIVNAETSLIVFALLFYFIAALEEGRRDATRKLRAYTQGLEKTVTEKELDSEAKNEFISMLGHEIRNPLASLLSSVEILKMGQADERERHHVVDAMEERIRLMSRLLDDIFDISRITRKKLALKKEIVSARTVLERTAEAADHRIRDNRHRFSVTLPKNDILINADPVRIEQLVSNLLYNATKYTPAGGSIELSGEYEELQGKGTLIIRVKDTGIGITKEEQGRIFEPYMQINPNQSLTGGIGLGLTLTRKLVELHDGTIEVRSEGRGRGSEFIVRIAAFRGTPEASFLSEHPPKAMSGTYKILVVDDNVSAAQSMGKLLHMYGYEIEVAYDGMEALKKERQMRPDAIVLDIGLPDINGYEVARRVRAKDSEALLIALSGYGPEMQRHKAGDVQFNHYLTKPVSVREILDLIPQSHTSERLVLEFNGKH